MIVYPGWEILEWRGIKYRMGNSYPLIVSCGIDNNLNIFDKVRNIWYDNKVDIPFDKFLNGLYPG
jgi:hypothetical protein